MSAKLPFDFSLRTLYDNGKNSFDVAFCLKSLSSTDSTSDLHLDSAALLKAHSCVLELHGQVFVDIICDARAGDAASTSHSNGQLTIRLVDALPFVVTEDVLEVFIKYLYYGAIEISGTDGSLTVFQAEEGRHSTRENGKKRNQKLDYASYALLFKRLYLLARHFRLTHLEGVCLKFFDSVLAPDKHALDVLDFGRCYGIMDLVTMVIDVVETSKSFFGDPEILALIRKDAIEFILSSTTRLPVPEHIVVEWLLIWKQAHNNAESFDILSQEAFLRFEQFPYDFLAKILNTGLLSDVEMMRVYKDKAAAQTNGVSSALCASKPVTPCAMIRYNGVSYEVGFDSLEFPAKLKRRFKRLIANFQVDDDVDLKQILTSTAPSSTVCKSSMSSLRGDATLAANGVVDGSVLIAVPKPKLRFKVVAVRKISKPKEKIPKPKKRGKKKRPKRSSEKTAKCKPEGPTNGKDAAALGASREEIEFVTLPMAVSEVDDGRDKNDRQIENRVVSDDTFNNNAPTCSKRDAFLRPRSDSFELKIDLDSPPRCRQTASECSSVDAGIAEESSSGATPLIEDPAIDQQFKENARERVFWWKNDTKGPKRFAAESCIAAITSPKSSVSSSFRDSVDRNLRAPPVEFDSRANDRIARASTHTSTHTTAQASGSSFASSPVARSTLSKPDLDDSGLSLDRSRLNETDISASEHDCTSVSNEGLAPPPTNTLRQRASRKRTSKESFVSSTSAAKAQSRTPSNKRTKASQSRDSLDRALMISSNTNPPTVDLSKRQPAAPDACFKQSVDVIRSRFEVGMKLEVPDPKAVVNTICIATVVDKIGPRLRLRLDGTDDRNDIWRLVNDASLRPIGTCEKRGHHLQPPFSFRKNISTWKRFLFETLKDAKISPDACFAPEPQAPIMLMVVGQRLEAVDRKNEALICPATVAEVTSTEVLVHFNGWNPESYDYWCDRNSRDLFPVGWCKKNEHPLQLLGVELQR